MQRVRLVLALSSALALAACGGSQSKEQSSDTPSPAPFEVPADNTLDMNATDMNTTASADAGPVVPAAVVQCKTCHTFTKDGAAGVGPNLFGTAGGKAAQRAGFAYSPALKATNLTWDDATLDKWLTKPQALVPGTKMTFAGYPEAAKRKEVIDFLKTLK